MKAIVVFDIDGVLRDVGNSYRRAIADTVEHYTNGAFRPTMEDIDRLKSEGVWNNDWEASQELIYRYFEGQNQTRDQLNFDYQEIVTFFQSRYLGPDPQDWTGYICDEPLLCDSTYFQQLIQADIPWGFFSGATRAEALYLLQGKLGIDQPVLVAMEDAPGKPDPTGLLEVTQQLIQQHQADENTPVIYIGDTVADLYTVEKAKQQQPSRHWIGVGVLPPHVQANESRCQAYSANLQKAGAQLVLSNVLELTPLQIEELI
ncbi:MAG: TIGR01548 family HAD-type hydrolase [Microcoleaceae cyanobacterium]